MPCQAGATLRLIATQLLLLLLSSNKTPTTTTVSQPDVQNVQRTRLGLCTIQ
jgi:hypothetical protein